MNLLLQFESLLFNFYHTRHKEIIYIQKHTSCTILRSNADNSGGNEKEVSSLLMKSLTVCLNFSSTKDLERTWGIT